MALQSTGSDRVYNDDNQLRIRVYRKLVNRVEAKLPALENRLKQFNNMFKLETDAPKSFYKIHYFLTDIKRMTKAAKTFITKHQA